jgi:hypothetical protein
MGLPYDLTSAGTYILLLLIVAMDYSIGSILGIQNLSSIFDPSIIYLGAIFMFRAPDSLSALFALLSWLLVTFMLLKAVQYFSEYFNWKWNGEIGDYKFQGPKYFEFLKKWQIVVVFFVVYASLAVIFWNYSVILYNYYIPDSAFDFTRIMFVPPAYRLFTFIPILISTVLIYPLYRSSRLPTLVKHVIPAITIAGVPLVSLGGSIIYYFTSPVMDVTRGVPDMSSMPEIYLISAIMLAVFKIVSITGMTLFILAFLSKGLELVDRQQVFKEPVD